MGLFFDKGGVDMDGGVDGISWGVVEKNWGGF